MALASRSVVQQEFAAGRGYLFPSKFATTVNATAATGTSNNLDVQISFNLIGTTLPGTLQDLPRPASPPRDWLPILWACGASAGDRVMWLAWFYKFGTVNLAATGNQITHDAATFPILRTRFGAASQPITLLPLLYITTATTVSAPAFVLEASGGGTGYVDQDGNNVDGSVTFTCPAAATVAQSCYLLRLEAGDVGVRDIVQVNVTAAGSAGAADLWGAELIAPAGPLPPYLPWTDTLFGVFGPAMLTPGVATSGTAVAKLGLLALDVNTSIAGAGWAAAVMNAA